MRFEPCMRRAIDSSANPRHAIQTTGVPMVEEKSLLVEKRVRAACDKKKQFGRFLRCDSGTRAQPTNSQNVFGTIRGSCWKTFASF